VYAGMTMEANEAIPPTNDRMPVLLEPAQYREWLSGSIADVIRFQFQPPIGEDGMLVERTDDLWRSGKQPRSFHQPSLL
jgi:putative SOS response-associated peptidase YedK